METKEVAGKDELAKLKQKVKDLESQLDEQTGWPANVADPLVIDLGKSRKKNIKALKKGRGKLLPEIAAAIEEIRSQLPEKEKDILALPIVLIYKSKNKSAKRLFGL